jgi:hypothetical protein
MPLAMHWSAAGRPPGKPPTADDFFRGILGQDIRRRQHDPQTARTRLGGDAGVACATAQATSIRADFSATFHPPDPCVATDLGDLTGWARHGSFALYYRFGRAGDLIRVSPGAAALSGIACGDSGATGFRFDLDLVQAATLYLSFEGGLSLPNPGPPELPAAAPLIELGEISPFMPEPGTGLLFGAGVLGLTGLGGVRRLTRLRRAASHAR